MINSGTIICHARNLFVISDKVQCTFYIYIYIYIYFFILFHCSAVPEVTSPRAVRDRNSIFVSQVWVITSISMSFVWLQLINCYFLCKVKITFPSNDYDWRCCKMSQVPRFEFRHDQHKWHHHIRRNIRSREDSQMVSGYQEKSGIIHSHIWMTSIFITGGFDWRVFEKSIFLTNSYQTQPHPHPDAQARIFPDKKYGFDLGISSI